MTGWRTVIFGALLALFGFLQTVDWLSVIPDNPKLEGAVVGVIGLIVMGLRYITTTPVGASK